jgi:hypothetical protein
LAPVLVLVLVLVPGTAAGRRSEAPQSRGAKAALAKAAEDRNVPALLRLLRRTAGPKRRDALVAIEGLQLGEDAAPLVPLLVTYLDDEDLRAPAASLLEGIGPKAAPAAPRLAQLLLWSAPQICDSDPLFPRVFRAAARIGPAPGQSRERWQADLVAGMGAVLHRLAPLCNLSAITSMPLTPELQRTLEELMTNKERSERSRALAAQALESLRDH